MIRFSRHVLCLFALIAALVSGARADGILQHIPGDALGVVVLHKLEAADAKLRQLEQIFAGSRPWTKPFDVLGRVAGSNDVVDVQGDAALALLPGSDPAAPFKPLLLVAVKDYAVLAAATGGDATGELAPVRIAGQDVLMAQHGNFALLMNVEHRSAMEALLNESFPPAIELATLKAWIETQDGALVVLPPGLRLLEKSAAKDDIVPVGRGPEAASEASSLLTGLKAAYGVDIRVVAVGARVDNATNLRLSVRALTTNDLSDPDVFADPPGEPAPLEGMADQPFVVAAAGDLRKDWVEPTVQLARRASESLAKESGYEEFDETQWKKLEESWRLMLSFSTIKLRMLVGEKTDPLISHISAVLTVKDAKAYIADARRAHELGNELTKLSSSDIKLIYDFSNVTIAGRQGLLISSDVAKAAGDEYPLIKAMWETTLGPGGVFRGYLVPVDEHTVVLAYGSEREAIAAVEGLGAKEQGLKNSPNMQTTINLVESGSLWTMYVSPSGCTAWFGRLYALLFGQFGAPALELKDAPAGPPLALSFNVVDRELQIDVVAPAQSLRDLAAIAKSWPPMP